MQSPETDEALRRPCMDVAVVMRRRAHRQRLATRRWVLADVISHQEGFGEKPRLLLKDAHEERLLHPGFRVELHRATPKAITLMASTPRRAGSSGAWKKKRRWPMSWWCARLSP